MQDTGIDEESSHPELCSEVAGGFTRIIVCLFREPDAGNPPVRFDEREQETEPSQTGLRRRGESSANCHREATVTAPLLDSTPDYTGAADKAANLVGCKSPHHQLPVFGWVAMSDACGGNEACSARIKAPAAQRR